MTRPLGDDDEPYTDDALLRQRSALRFAAIVILCGLTGIIVLVLAGAALVSGWPST